jgi:hypothetical protein
MLPKTKPRMLLLLWTALLGAPTAWSLSLGTMFWLTHPVCQGMTHAAILIAGIICALLAAGAGLLARHMLRDAGETAAMPDSGPFLLRMAIGASAIFTLVIVLSLVPLAMLTPCPV